MNPRSQSDIEALVRQVVARTIGQGSQRPIVDADLLRQAPANTTYPVAANALVTPLARQIALERRIKLVVEGEENMVEEAAASLPHSLAIGADHGGYQLKETLKGFITGLGYTVIDCGTHSQDSVDYPDFAYAVARTVANKQAQWGIIIDGAGIGSCMVANKVPGIRAAMCYDQATAFNSREHNNANVLTLGAGLIGSNLAQQIVRTWLTTDFAGGRHAQRVDKIEAIARRYQK